MNTQADIQTSRDALKRIVASLVAMAGLASSNMTIRRSLRLAVLRILRPAESAARRLIVAASHGLTVELPKLRTSNPAPIPECVQAVIHVVLSPHDGWGTERRLPPGAVPYYGPDREFEGWLPLLQPPKPPTPPRKPKDTDAPQRTPQFFLFDRLVRSRHKKPAAIVPRIRSLGPTAPYDEFGRPVMARELVSAPRKSVLPVRGDLLDATRIAGRLTALGMALNDLPRQALRFARWQARADRAMNWIVTPPAERVGPQPPRPRRMFALRDGHPPGGRRIPRNPNKKLPKNIREIDRVLAQCHRMALTLLEGSDPLYDTS